MRQVLSRQVLGKGMLTAAAASSLLSIATGAAHAQPGAMAEASHSPGVLSGNSVSVPITFAPNVCGNSVDGGAALNPSMGNTCATTTGSDAAYDYERHLSPEHAAMFERYLDERQGGRHAMPQQRDEEPRRQAPRHAAPRHAAARHDEARHDDPRHQGGHGSAEEECDGHPPVGPPNPEPRPQAEHPTPVPHPAPPAPRPLPQPHPLPGPVAEHPAPKPLPEPVPMPEAPAPVQEAPQTLPAPEPEWEQPKTLPAPAPGPSFEDEVTGPPRGSMPVTHPAPAPAPEVVRPADQPPAAPAGDLPVHLPPVPAPAPAPAPVTAPAPALPPMVAVPAPAAARERELAATGAGESAAAAALATALILGGAILYRRSRIA
ncbi:chaplin [Streptomyces sp. H27-H5]|uniref:chaplin n=1 Tax=Streptomyces sp. H27-H5 TaxID=2996460 RepID=UPI00227169B4|nr:chaplin family protein [Streptomyces sp. H27-H5]MCY0961150.1 chaplin family protein [Streptomyces sp. H27-H5]